MSKSFQLTLVRHGETDLNVQGILQGHIDEPLNKNGKFQAVSLGKYLKKEQFSHWFSSDLQRATETCMLIKLQNKFAKETSNEGNDRKIIKDERIRERKFGVLEGKQCEALYAAAKKAKTAASNYAAEGGGETEKQMKDRVEEFFRYLFIMISEDCQDQTAFSNKYCANVIVVAHGGVIGVTVGLLKEKYGCECNRRMQYCVNNASQSCFVVNLPAFQQNDSLLFESHEEENNDCPEYSRSQWLNGITVRCTRFNHVTYDT